jgi:hypothetical protein
MSTNRGKPLLLLLETVEEQDVVSRALHLHYQQLKQGNIFQRSEHFATIALRLLHRLQIKRGASLAQPNDMRRAGGVSP